LPFSSSLLSKVRDVFKIHCSGKGFADLLRPTTPSAQLDPKTTIKTIDSIGFLRALQAENPAFGSYCRQNPQDFPHFIN
jgi:hypothetical protein